MFNHFSTYVMWLRALSLTHLWVLFAVFIFVVSVVNSTPLTFTTVPQTNSNDLASASTVKKQEEKPDTVSTHKQNTSSSPQKKILSTSTTKKSQPQPVATSKPSPAPAATPSVAPAYDTISIPSLAFSSRIVPVGVTSENNVDVHPTLVGWYNGSSAIGSKGAAFLDGHNPGVFSSLPNIRVSDQITITMSGTSYKYKVLHREIVALKNVDMNKVLSVYGSATEGLNLMTCIGPYNPQTDTTDERLIVYAVRI